MDFVMFDSAIIIQYQIAKLFSSMQYSNMEAETLWKKNEDMTSKSWYEKQREFL